MDRLFNAKRKKLREPPQQPISPRELTDAISGPSRARNEREAYTKVRIHIHQDLEVGSPDLVIMSCERRCRFTCCMSGRGR